MDVECRSLQAASSRFAVSIKIRKGQWRMAATSKVRRASSRGRAGRISLVEVNAPDDDKPKSGKPKKARPAASAAKSETTPKVKVPAKPPEQRKREAEIGSKGEITAPAENAATVN